MKLAIIGGTGFLGKCFLKEYGSTFSQIKLLTRIDTSYDQLLASPFRIVKGTLCSRNAINTLLSGMDVLVHAGFDHTYRENIQGINNILSSVSHSENTIRRVIYLSSYVVYDRSEYSITEQSAESDYCDIYTREKQLIENIIRESKSQVQFIILQPTIVLGAGGNWSKVLVEAAHSEVVKLSNGGSTTCNFVHVKDVAEAILRAVEIPSQKLPNRVTSFLVPGGKATWKKVLSTHGQGGATHRASNDTDPKIEETYNGQYGNSFLQNLVISALYTPAFRIFTHPIMKYAKRRIERSKRSNQNPLPCKEYRFQGLSKSIQQVDHQVSGEKAKSVLGYIPSFTLLDIGTDLSQKIPGLDTDAAK